MYADALYRLLQHGFSATTETGEVVKLAPQSVATRFIASGDESEGVRPNLSSSTGTPSDTPTPQLPGGCSADQHTDYPGAVNCIVSPAKTYDCNQLPDNAPCTYESAHRPSDNPINFVVIHDIEGTAHSAISTFQNIKNEVSIHYIVDADGTTYEM